MNENGAKDKCCYKDANKEKLIDYFENYTGSYAFEFLQNAYDYANFTLNLPKLYKASCWKFCWPN